MSRPLHRWGPVGAWASLILIATSAPIPTALADVPPSGSDKLVHAAIYSVLGWLVARALDTASVRTALRALVMASLFGAVDEWHQAFVPGRSRDSLDWAADSAGAAVGAFAFLTARRRREPVP